MLSGAEALRPSRAARVQPKQFSETTLNLCSPPPPIASLPAFQGWGLELLAVSGQDREKRSFPLKTKGQTGPLTASFLLLPDTVLHPPSHAAGKLLLKPLIRPVPTPLKIRSLTSHYRPPYPLPLHRPDTQRHAIARPASKPFPSFLQGNLPPALTSIHTVTRPPTPLSLTSFRQPL